MGFFTRCDDCGTNRIPSLDECPTCAVRKAHGACRCLRVMVDGRCPHCDRDCPGCDTCATFTDQRRGAEMAMRDMPHPTVAELREPAASTGALVRCGSCGGRVYMTDSGPWCPRAFCAA